VEVDIGHTSSSLYALIKPVFMLQPSSVHKARCVKTKTMASKPRPRPETCKAKATDPRPRPRPRMRK